MDSIRMRSDAVNVPSLQAFREAREARPSVSALLEQADGVRAKQLPPAERQQQEGVLTRVFDHSEQLHVGLPSSFGCMSPERIRRCFPHLSDEQRVNQATQPDPRDNGTASEVKRGYRDAMAQARREHTVASRIASRLGPGEHTLSNGDRVQVSKAKDGTTSVTTTSPDGATKTVTFNPSRPNDVHVRKVGLDGNAVELERHGTTVTRREHAAVGGCLTPTERRPSFQGDETTTTYSLDAQGRPVRETSSRGGEDTLTTTVNTDGSTDTRTSLYRDEDGNMVYGNTHEPGHPTPKPKPRPPADWPFPSFPPLEGGGIPASGLLPAPVRL